MGITRSRPRHHQRQVISRSTFGVIEQLEARQLLATVAVNANSVYKQVSTDLLGINLAWWDSSLNTAQTKSMVQAAGLTSFRFPGGSSADEFHLTEPPSYNGKGTIASFAQFIKSVNGGGVVTLDYGSGSPQEAAAELAYLNASVGDTTPIGSGLTWSTGASGWSMQDFKTAGYWASLRAASPLATDDGLNFLRIGQSAPFAFHYYEIGNEVYGISWETDHHGTNYTPAGGSPQSTGASHDPATYVSFAKQFAAYAAQIDPSISIGLAIVAGTEQNNWTPHVISQLAAQSYTPGFLIDHNYVYGPNQENDNTLLHSVSVPGYSGWNSRATQYRTLLTNTLGSSTGNQVRLMTTEFNSVYSNPGKQTTSLVNGLYFADSLGSLMYTEYDGAWAWDLRNGFDTANNNNSTIYGWRTGGDYGILGSGGTAPQSGTYIPYPSYFAEQLASKVITNGASSITVSSNDTNLAVYATKQSNGHLTLLVINKSQSGLNDNTTGTPGTISTTFNFTGFTPASSATMYRYSSIEDNAQKNSSNGAASATTINQALTVNGSSFTFAFPSFSMYAMDLAPAVVVPPPNVTAAAYPYNVRPDAVQFTFDADVSASLSASDLTLTKIGGGTAPAVQSVTWDSASKTATFVLAPGIPADANYTATLIGAGVNAPGGPGMSSNYALDFFVLAGDANQDRKVDIVDLGALATNWQGSSRSFSQGDFNYDGTVNIVDLGILASNWQASLAEPAAPLSVSALWTSSPFATPPRAPIATAPVLATATKRTIDLVEEPASAIL